MTRLEIAVQFMAADEARAQLLANDGASIKRYLEENSLDRGDGHLLA